MPDQEEHDKVENLVEAPGVAAQAARTLQQAANSNQSLEGFEAINNERITDDLKREAEEDDPQDREKGHAIP